jgi:polar amino acid transport system substrate-binding protein
MLRRQFIIILALSVTIFPIALMAGRISTEQVTDLVEQTAKDIAEDASGTLAKINAGAHPYRDKDNPALYTFVFNTDLVTVAHFRHELVGLSKRGKPDLKGKMFRDEILAGALDNGSGWEDYYFENPESGKTEPKTTYFRLVTGSDGVKYIVCSGKYIDR